MHPSSPNASPGGRSARREAARRARDAFPPMGIYAIRDLATGRVRVASSRNVPGTIHRIRFELRLRSHPDKALQAAWDAGGAERITIEVLELVKERSDPHFDYAAELRALEAIQRELLAAEGGAP